MRLMRLSPGLPLAGCLVALASFSGAWGQHFPSNEELRHTRAVREPRLSSDGNRVLITVAEPTADGGKTHLWVAEVAGTASRQLTFSPKGDGRGEFSARWMPDDSAILFLAKRGETTQIFRLPMMGGEAAPFDLKYPPAAGSSGSSNVPPVDEKETSSIDVSAFEISADSKWLAILAKDPETAAEKKKQSDKDDANFVDHEERGVRLYLGALDASGTVSGSLIRADVAADVRGIAWANHSSRLAVVSEAPNNAGDLHPARTVAVVEQSGAGWKSAAVPSIPPTVAEELVWTKDDNGLLLLAQAEDDAPPGVNDLYLAGLAGGHPRLLSSGFKGSLQRIVASTSTSAVVEATVGMSAVLASFPAAGTSRAEIHPAGQPVVTGASSNQQQTGWVYLASSSAIPPELCFTREPGSACKKLAAPATTPGDWRSVSAQPVSWKSGEFTIEGLLYLSPQSREGKVPLVVDVHGGPTGQYTAAYSAFVQFLVGQGWAVLQTNPRGSTGYGTAFAAANKNDLGGGDYQDIMAGVDSVIARYPVDAGRLALIGYSYGGEMAGFVEGKTDRFRAIVSGAPVIDQMSEYGTESSSLYDRWFYGYPWQHPEDAWRQSPLSGVGRAKTPFLLLQGGADTTDPPGQSEEMYRALRQAGVAVELVEYPREDHGPLAMGMMGYPSREPWHGFDARKRLVDFISRQFQTQAKK